MLLHKLRCYGPSENGAILTDCWLVVETKGKNFKVRNFDVKFILTYEEE